MAKCDHCRTETEIPYECSFCGGMFCEDHRLPENHNCRHAPARTPLGSHQAKQNLLANARAKERQKEIMISEGDYHFKKKTLPTLDLTKEIKEKKRKFRSFKKDDGT